MAGFGHRRHSVQRIAGRPRRRAVSRQKAAFFFFVHALLL
jgi:hypothetical protein